QAEDGIRDRNVTGVQTCALPISGNPHCLKAVPVSSIADRVTMTAWGLAQSCANVAQSWPSSMSAADRLRSEPQESCLDAFRPLRSEERRVGKEWRIGWSPSRVKE